MESSQKISNIIQCFADLNLETNENYPYDINLPRVSFEQSVYQSSEGQLINVILFLDRESESGSESVIIVDIDSLQEDIETKKIYQEVSWEPSEQYKTITIAIPSDFTIESNQEFIDIGIAGLSGVLEGEIIQARILINNTTSFRTLSIYAPDDVNVLNLRSANEISIQTPEGTDREFTLSLDQPSYGIEEIDVIAYKQSSETKRGLGIVDSSDFLIRKTISWSSGELLKKISTAEILGESLNISHDGLTITVGNPKNLNINPNTFNLINIDISQSTTKRRYTSIDLHNIFIQKGGLIDYETAETRRIINGSTVDSNTNNWLIEIGTYYQDETISQEISEDTNYTSYPEYFFGTNLQEDNFPVYLVIENTGEVSSEINGEIIEPNQSKEFRVYRDSLQFILPSNSTLIKSGKVFENEYLSEIEDVYAETKYAFSIKLGFPKIKNSNGNDVNPHNFILRGATEFDGNIYNIGEFTFENFKDERDARKNSQILTSYYRSLKTTFNGSCTQDFNGNDKVKNIKIHGIILLDDGKDSESQAFGHTFETTNINPICQTISRVTSGNPWSSLEYEIYENPDF